MLQKTKRSAVSDGVTVFLITLIVLRDLFIGNMIYVPSVLLLHAGILELLVVGQLWSAYRRGNGRTKMERTLLRYAAWALLTRFLLLDFAEKIGLEVLTVCEMCVAFCAIRGMDRKAASRIFTLAAAILCAVLTVWCVCGMVVVLTDIGEIRLLDTVIRIAAEDIWTTTGDAGLLKFLDYYPVHRNESSAWMMIGLWLLAYQWSVCKRKLWRIPMAFSMLMLYLSIALQRSRSVCVITGLTVGLLAASGLLRLNWKKLPKYLLMAVTVVLCTFVVYKSFSAVSTGLSGISAMRKEAVTAQASIPSADALLAETPQAEPAAEAPKLVKLSEATPVSTEPANDPVLTDQRSFFRDLLTLTQRTRIWKCEAYALVHHPLLLVFGQREDEVAWNMVRYGGLDIPAYHTHNGFLQILATFGLPGLVLFVLFLLPLLKKILRVYLGNAPMSAKILTLPLIGLLVYSVMEPMFSSLVGLASVLFMLIAGKLCREETGNAAPDRVSE